MTTYAKDLPFPTDANHTFVKLMAPSAFFPSHYTPRQSGRYLANYDGVVYCPEQYVEELLSEGCTLADGVTIDRPNVDPPNQGNLPSYRPLQESAPQKA